MRRIFGVHKAKMLWVLYKQPMYYTAFLWYISEVSLTILRTWPGRTKLIRAQGYKIGSLRY